MMWLNATLFAYMLIGGLGPQDQQIDLNLLKGAWTTGGPSFDWVISDKAILFESDMREHPYRVEGAIIVIDDADAAIMQRQRIMRLTLEELEVQEERFGGVTVFRRMKSEARIRLEPRPSLSILF